MIKRIAVAVAIIGCLSAAGAQPGQLRKASDDPKWAEAVSLFDSGDYAGAENKYREVLAQYPHDQRAALRIAIAQGRQKKADESLQAYDRAVEMDPFGEWAPVGLFYKARAAHEFGREDEMRASIEKLRRLHPDSSYIAQAAVLEKEARGEDAAAEKRALERELAAAAEYDAALAIGDGAEKLNRLAAIASQFPDTATALRALESKAHLLTLDREKNAESSAAFLAIMEKIGRSAPESRIAQTALTRLAALQHREENREGAIELYLKLAELESPDPELKANALLQTAGLLFEIIQRAESPTKEQFDLVLELCAAVKELPSKNPENEARAGLIEMEILFMQGRSDDVLEKLLAYIASHSEEESPTEVGTAWFGLALTTRGRGDLEASLEAWENVIRIAGDKDELWPGMDNVARAHMFRLVTLHELCAPLEDRIAAAEALYTKYPDSVYTEVTRSNEFYYLAADCSKAPPAADAE